MLILFTISHYLLLGKFLHYASGIVTMFCYPVAHNLRQVPVAIYGLFAPWTLQPMEGHFAP